MKNLRLLVILIFLFGCSEKKNHPYTFYYWRTTLKLNELEQKELNNSTSNTLYTRFFDVDKINGKLQPVAIANYTPSFKTDKKVVPVIFITNKSFIGITPTEIDALAKGILNVTENKRKEYQLLPTDEIQIDCDWTAGTKDDFFSFLKKLSDLTKKKITSTIRLHQIKDKDRMGVPPVKKVYLMCYSTSSPLENSDKNSILDVGILKSYLKDIQNYPIKTIDVALPIYSWGIVTNHFGNHKLINGLNYADLNNPNFKKLSESKARVEKDGFYFGHYLNKGFEIKVEQINNEDLDEVINYLDKKIKNYTIVYYQLDSQFLENKNFS